MKSVLISIHPEQVQQILSGKKKIECRKTKPAVQSPFKVYIYCTYGTGLIEFNDDILPNMLLEEKVTGNAKWGNCCNGKVVAEFQCEQLVAVLAHPSVFAGHPLFYQKAIEDACLTREEVEAYSGGRDVIGWVIQGLKIYDKPKELTDFIVPSKIGCCNEGKCRGCSFLERGNVAAGIEDDCTASFDTDEYKPLRRPPQSWCYVEELK